MGIVSVCTMLAHAGGTTSWLNPVDGDWNIGVNWNTGIVPGIGNPVTLGHAGAYTVTSPASQSMESLMISNPSVQLNTGNATTTAIAGDVLNNGLIVVNFTSNISSTTLRFDADTMLSGSGSILLNAPTSRARVLTGAGFTFTQASGHAIHGQGQIGGSMINNGTVSSDSGGTMTLLSADKMNNNIIESINGSTLVINGISIGQGLAGIIRADGAGSSVSIIGSTIMGGTLNTTMSGDISFDGTSTIDGVNNEGSLDIKNAVTVTVFNSLHNDGTITINPTGNISATQLRFDDSMTVTGDGTFLLGSAGARARIQTGLGATVTMGSMQTVRGQGQIEASMINEGLISSDTVEIRMLTNDKINNATMQAVEGAVLEFTGITVTQGGAGLIEADGIGSQVELINSTVIGGSIESSNGADVSVDASSTIDSVDISGVLNVQNAVLLSVENGLTNNGSININPTGNISATQIQFNDSMVVGGTGEFVLSSSDVRARIQTGPGAVVTMPATQTIRGFGRIEADMVNNGLISADAGEIRLANNPKTNNATIEAINASIIEITGITIDQSSGGTIAADDAGSQVELLNSTVIGGTVSAAPGADVSIDVSSTFDGVSTSGQVNVQNAQTLTIESSLANAGVIEINPTGNISITSLLFNDSMTVVGNGSIKLNSIDTRARIQSAVDTTVTMSSSHTIHGQGRIEASMMNNGTITSDVINGEIRLTNNPKTNNGIIQANNESNLEFNGITVTQGASGLITADGTDSEIEMVGATISGGSLTTTNGADVSVDTASVLDDVDFSGLLNIVNASTLAMTDGTLNNGLIVVNETANISGTNLQWNDEFTLGGTGTIRLNSSNARSVLRANTGVSQGGLGSGQRLEGIGRIAIDLINNGTIAPGLSIGTMHAAAPVLFTATSSYEAEVNGTTSDLLDNSSTIELHGNLDILFVDGFNPAGFWVRTVMEGSDITGKFDSVSAPAAPSGLVTRVVNTGTEILIGQTCQADLNLDGGLNFFDVSQFLSDFAAENEEADLNNDGSFNFFDVSVFLANFSTCSP